MNEEQKAREMERIAEREHRRRVAAWEREERARLRDIERQRRELAHQQRLMIREHARYRPSKTTLV